MEEIEVKFFIENKDSFRSKLENIGAKKIHNDFLMKRVVYDIPGSKAGDWVRIRQESDCVRLTFKSKTGEGLGEMKEVEVMVSDFDKMYQILEHTHLKKLAYQENYREVWEYKEAEIVIDVWPWLPSYIEIEGKTKELVLSVAKELGFDIKEGVFGTVVNLYQKIYDISLNDFHAISNVNFQIDIPKILLDKKRHL